MRAEEQSRSMIDEPIVVAKRRDGKTLRIECPHCHHHHTHGTDGGSRLYLGHRLAHCAEAHLPKQLRQRRSELGYHLVDLTEVRMSEQGMSDLFSEMDKIADASRESPTWVPADDQVGFVRLIREHRPDLTREQRDDLFTLWREHDRALQQADLAAARTHMAALWEERRNLFIARKFLPRADWPDAVQHICGRIVAQHLHIERLAKRANS